LEEGSAIYFDTRVDKNFTKAELQIGEFADALKDLLIELSAVLDDMADDLMLDESPVVEVSNLLEIDVLGRWLDEETRDENLSSISTLEKLIEIFEYT